MGIPGRPRVAVFTLGGTIAMQATPGEVTAPALSASDLLVAVPRLRDRADWRDLRGLRRSKAGQARVPVIIGVSYAS